MTEQLRPALPGLAHRMLGSRAEAEAVVQEALLLLHDGVVTHVTELVPDGDRVRGVRLVSAPPKVAAPC